MEVVIGRHLPFHSHEHVNSPGCHPLFVETPSHDSKPNVTFTTVSVMAGDIAEGS